jgi:hypothetical protein
VSISETQDGITRSALPAPRLPVRLIAFSGVTVSNRHGDAG